jgi:hypothetical protein
MFAGMGRLGISDHAIGVEKFGTLSCWSPYEMNRWKSDIMEK